MCLFLGLLTAHEALGGREWILFSKFTGPNVFSEQMTSHFRKVTSRGREGCTQDAGHVGVVVKHHRGHPYLVGGVSQHL